MIYVLIVVTVYKHKNLNLEIQTIRWHKCLCWHSQIRTGMRIMMQHFAFGVSTVQTSMTRSDSKVKTRLTKSLNSALLVVGRLDCVTVITPFCRLGERIVATCRSHVQRSWQTGAPCRQLSAHLAWTCTKLLHHCYCTPQACANRPVNLRTSTFLMCHWNHDSERKATYVPLFSACLSSWSDCNLLLLFGWVNVKTIRLIRPQHHYGCFQHLNNLTAWCDCICS